MEIKFGQKVCKHLHSVISNMQDQEQTQELKLPEGMPDIGRILGAWGQMILRGKQWRGSEMEVSGGAMIWVLYLPEDGDEPQCIEGWLPFQMRWDFPAKDRDGIINAVCYLKSVDARVVSSRKMILRAGFGVHADAYIPQETAIHTPESDTDEVQILKRKYSVCVPKEAGEKTFGIEEYLTMPPSCPEIAKILRYDMRLEITDKKVLSQKVVFRGAALLGMLYCANDGALYHWDFEVPFSQYADLENEYENDASVCLNPVVTGLELDIGEEGKIHLKAGIVGQYVVYDRQSVEIVQDAYCLNREVSMQRSLFRAPALLDIQTDTVHIEKILQVPANRVVEAALCLEGPQITRQRDKTAAEIKAQVQVLYYDNEGKLQSEQIAVSENWETGVAEDADVKIDLYPSGTPQLNLSSTGLAVRFDAMLNAFSTANENIDMVSSVELGDMKDSAPDRPSLILRRAAEDDLWHIAKSHGSTVAAIMETNRLQGEPDANKMLIIPLMQ